MTSRPEVQKTRSEAIPTVKRIQARLRLKNAMRARICGLYGNFSGRSDRRFKVARTASSSMFYPPRLVAHADERRQAY